MTDRPHSPVVVGLGNVLLGDDGAGPAVCEELRRRTAGVGSPAGLPVETRLVDGGTMGSLLLGWLLDASAIVVVDAIHDSGRPGSLHVHRGPTAASLDCHDGELGRLLEAAVIGGLPRDAISVVGIVPDRIEPGIGLSSAIAAAVPLAATVAAREVRALAGGAA